MKSHPERAVEAFAGSCNCAQAVLSVYAEELGLDAPTARRLASTLGGGLGHTGTLCGAAAGAFLVLGLRHGDPGGGDRAQKEKGYAACQEFLRRFEARCGARDCKVLIGYDVSDPVDLARAREARVFQERCPEFVRAACEILDEAVER